MLLLTVIILTTIHYTNLQQLPQSPVPKPNSPPKTTIYAIHVTSTSYTSLLHWCLLLEESGDENVNINENEKHSPLTTETESKTKTLIHALLAPETGTFKYHSSTVEPDHNLKTEQSIFLCHVDGFRGPEIEGIAKTVTIRNDLLWWVWIDRVFVFDVLHRLEEGCIIDIHSGDGGYRVRKARIEGVDISDGGGNSNSSDWGDDDGGVGCKVCSALGFFYGTFSLWCAGFVVLRGLVVLFKGLVDLVIFCWVVSRIVIV